MSKPFKMRGTPFKRNFGIGETESPDKTSPASLNINWGEVAGKAVEGFGNWAQKTYGGVNPTNTEEKDEEGNPVEKESIGSKLVKSIIGSFKKDESTEDVTDEEKEE